MQKHQVGNLNKHPVAVIVAFSEFFRGTSFFLFEKTVEV